MSITHPSHVRELLQRDRIFGFINERYGIPPNWARPEGFISLSKIILEQQVSLPSANAHFLKLNNYLNGFTPDNILKLTDEEMKRCQISRQKAMYLRSLSNAIIKKHIVLESLSDLNEVEIRRQLVSIKGIGDWTSDIYLMFCLQRTDIFPAGDVAIKNTIRELTDAQTEDDTIVLAEKWRPFRTLAAYFLWHYYLKKRSRPSVQFV